MTKTALLNLRRLDRDGALDLAMLRQVADLVVHEDVASAGVVAAARGCEVLISKEVKIDADQMAQLGAAGVRLICEAGTGYDNLDVPAARAAGIHICNVPSYSTAAVAQLTMSFVLGIAAGTLGFVQRTARGDYRDFAPTPPACFEVGGKVLGIIGPGAIGQAVAARARAFDMQVLTSGRTARTWSDAGMRHVDRAQLLASSDFVSLHCPLRRDAGADGTWHLIDAAALASMKPTAWLINVSRGGLVDEAALVAAVASGALAGAALDVHEHEPAAPSAELRAADRIHLTPHAGWKPLESRQRLLAAVADNIRAFAAGEPTNVVG